MYASLTDILQFLLNRRTITFLLTFLGTYSFGQINHELKAELDSIAVQDIKYRALLTELIVKPNLKDSLEKAYKSDSVDISMFLSRKQSEIDRSNMASVKSILLKYGYPGKDLVGTPTNSVVWSVIQHSEEIDNYFSVIVKAAKEKQIPFTLVALTHDRILQRNGKLQLYGTQLMCLPPRAQPDHTECFVWPIQNHKTVNNRRKKAGFTESVGKYSKRFGVKYKYLSLKQVKKMYRIEF